MSISTTRGPARLRTALFTSAALASMVIAGAAHAQAGPDGPETSIREPQDGGGVSSIAPPGSTVPVGSILEPQVVASPPDTPTSIVDPTNVTGVGQMVIDQKNGFIGLCTGTLINPRTVIFAAHCVGENPAGTGFQDPWGYGTANGGLPISFGFAANNLPALRTWYLPGAGQYLTNTANYLYNVNQVVYNPQSKLLGPDNIFLQGDVAMASLDTPAANVPTWAILLSALPQVTNVDLTTGTGYHVVVEGYGTNGSGQGGANGGIDYRRRVAENYLGILGSLDDVDSFLFGSPDGLPQNLYQVDFDSRRGSAVNAQTSIYDFNIFRDASLPHEGITGPGDSGGPLILDKTYSTPVVIGVLSGGSRYYSAQASSSYGTSSFYQPLYLFWDYIAANNFYHYVGAKAGDGNWTDPTHWVSLLDPSYKIISNGQLVNGLPSTLGDGIIGTSGKFGDVCFDTATSSDCYNLATGVETYTVGGNTQTFVNTPPSGTPGTAVVPGATIANGLPGATNFVPDNNDPILATKTNARYYDVTLGAAGTTTLSSAVRIDRFTILGAQSQLNVTSAGSLTSNIDFTQTNGLVTNNGTISVAGDYFMLLGGLQGSGRINTPFFTSVSGMIAPGTMGTIGTLTFGGNVILSSGNNLVIDLGSNGSSDKIAVVATKYSAPGVATDGFANIGGTVFFAPVAGSTIRSGDVFTILTSDNTRTGTFNTPASLSAILSPTFIYSANDVKVRIVAGTYASVVSSASPVQAAFAQLLDGDRAGSYSALSALYGPLDLQNQATIRSTLESWAPRTETLRTALGTVAVDNMARFYVERIADLGKGGGTVAVIGQPLNVVANLNNVGPMGSMGADTTGAPVVTTVSTGKVPDDISVYFAGGYINGDAAPMPTAIPLGGRNKFDGYYGAVGIEKQVNSALSLGFGLSYTDVKGTTISGSAKGKLYQGTIYGKYTTVSGFGVDGVFSAGLFDSSATRSATLVGTPYTLKSNDQALALSGEIGISQMFDLGGVKLGPRAAVRRSGIGFSDTIETGGPMALRIDRDGHQSTQGRLGLTLGGGSASVRPYLSGYYVHDFQKEPASFGANFVGGVGPAAQFALAGRDKDWWEVSGGLSLDLKNVTLSVGADTTIDRTDVKNQSYRGAIKFRF